MTHDDDIVPWAFVPPEIERVDKGSCRMTVDSFRLSRDSPRVIVTVCVCLIVLPLVYAEINPPLRDLAVQLAWNGVFLSIFAAFGLFGGLRRRYLLVSSYGLTPSFNRPGAGRPPDRVIDRIEEIFTVICYFESTLGPLSTLDGCSSRLFLLRRDAHDKEEAVCLCTANGPGPAIEASREIGRWLGIPARVIHLSNFHDGLVTDWD